MKQRTKRIIAREGLIILCLIFIGLGFIVLAAVKLKAKNDFMSTALQVRLLDEAFDLNKLRRESLGWSKQTTLEERERMTGIELAVREELLKKRPPILLFAEGTSERVIKATIARDFGDVSAFDVSGHSFLDLTKRYNVIAYYDETGNPLFQGRLYEIIEKPIENDTFWLLLFLYALYLITRFVIRFVQWAARTLRQKEESA